MGFDNIRISGKLDQKDMMVFCYIIGKLRHLIEPKRRDKYSRRKAFDTIMEEIYGVRHFSSDILNAKTDNDAMAVIEDAGLNEVFFLCDNEVIYQAFGKTVELFMDWQTLQEEIKEARSRNRVPGKGKIEDCKKMEKAFGKTIKVLSEMITGEKKKDDSGILSRYGILDDIVGSKKKKDGYLDWSKNPEELYEDMMEYSEDEEEEYEDEYSPKKKKKMSKFTIDDFRNGVIPQGSGFLKFVDKVNKGKEEPEQEKKKDSAKMKEMKKQMNDIQKTLNLLIQNSPPSLQPAPVYPTISSDPLADIRNSLTQINSRLNQNEQISSTLTNVVQQLANSQATTQKRKAPPDEGEDDSWDDLGFGDTGVEDENEDSRFEFQKLIDEGITDPKILRDSVRKEFGNLIGNPGFTSQERNQLKEMATNALQLIEQMEDTGSSSTSEEEIMGLIGAGSDDEELPKIPKNAVDAYNDQHAGV